jgi:17beta-estradiol 17-dehydrogenase / very-long-chain 3-oxoacyl-CoA reductase
MPSLEWLGALSGIYFAYTFLNFVYLHFLCSNSLQCYRGKSGGWALVTGASAGIGEAFAEELAKRGLNLILVARSAQILQEISLRLQKKYNIQTLVIPSDCGRVEETIEKIFSSLKDLSLTMLINNVGVEFGEPSPLLEKSSEQVNGMIDINVRFTTLLTMKLLPILIQNTSTTTRSAIINVASVAHNVSPPLVAVYSGTKSYTTTFSQSLSSELRTHYPGALVDVLCVRPGFVETKMSGLIANSLKGYLLQVWTRLTLFLPNANDLCTGDHCADLCSM